MSDIQEAYSKGYEAGKNAILRMVKYVLDNAPKGYDYKISLSSILEVYDYGKEKKDSKQEKAASAASKS